MAAFLADVTHFFPIFISDWRFTETQNPDQARQTVANPATYTRRSSIRVLKMQFDKWRISTANS